MRKRTKFSETTIDRRTVAQGTLWAVPVIMAAASAPAFAASPGVVSAGICGLFYGGGTINSQTHSIFLSVEGTGTIKKGTTVTWNVSVTGGGSGTGGTNMVPNLTYSADNIYTLTTTPASGTPVSSFTVTLTVNQDTDAGNLGCDAGIRLVWTDTTTIRPGATVSISGSSNQPTSQKSSLSYTVAKRWPNSVNSAGRTPHVYLSKSGAQTCYPSIQWSRVLPKDGYDNVTCYGSASTGCTPSSGGTVQTSQYVTPQVC